MTLATCSWFEYRLDMGLPIRISLGTPRWKGAPKPFASMWELTPRGWYFHADPEDFTSAYLSQLERYGVEHINQHFRELREAGSGYPLILCCFERLDTSPLGCHRRTFARWWQERTGETIPELGAMS